MRAVAAPLSLLFTLLLSLTACAQESGQFKEGQHYQVLPQAVPQKDDSKIEVTELFWYGCGHCYHFEPILENWKKGVPEDVALLKVPAIWQPVMEVHARMYYVAEAMGVLDKMHQPIFNAINNERKMFATREGREWNPDLKAIEALFNQHGADGAKAAKLMNSFAISSKVKQGSASQRAYQLSGTPEVVVAGKYRISTSLPGFKGKSDGQQMMLEVADYLIAKERADKG
ncbi:thiol:disulfide interchange protein DsbA/DsbL [Microbulbifer rhizosphaerae]|uniref:Thiol:disulfide interchange protein n=1 Tax=Microbulbifer rhizosphaerae TaxID=1562603 RepID=A0A7W4WES6_9GAMM|nr:thiol:disulfide interchange protein DsbA/DsbL [Microbulbifer rhizosphaerae]MBB3062910.1 thiol:disulfide interchange protein DsbA [Microbulbifer rhizosphaerae]